MPKGKIVSIHESKIQTQDGTTTCFGVYDNLDGKFLDWTGSVTKLEDDSVIGKAKLIY